MHTGSAGGREGKAEEARRSGRRSSLVIYATWRDD